MMQRGVLLEPSMITALTFGMCGLAGTRSGTRYTSAVIYALVAIVLVVFPRIDMSTNDELLPIVSEIQRLVLLYSIGTIVTAVCLTTSSTIQSRA